MDKIISKLAGFGVPALVMLVAVSATGLGGAAAITAALAAIGPGGMIGGVLTLLIAGVAVDAITEFGFDRVFSGVVNELKKRGESKESILAQIDKYPISSSLKAKLREAVNNA